MARITDPGARQYLGQPGVVASTPGTGPKPQPGFAAPDAPPVAPIVGGAADPNYIAKVKGIETGISTAGQIAAARAGAAATGANQLAAQREKARLDQEAADRNAGTLQGDARNDAMQKIAALKLLQQQVGRSGALYNKNLKGSGVLQSLGEYLPTQNNKQYDASVDGITPLARAAFRVPGSGADSDKESDAFTRLLPDRFNFDAANEQKYSQMNDIIRQSIMQQNQLLGGARRTAAPPRPKGGGGPSRIKNDADYDRLPSGATYVSPDGKTRTKR